MATLTLDHLHAFFRWLSEHESYACMLGGAVESTPLNQWVMIGLRAKQQVLLAGNYLAVNGKVQSLDGPEAEKMLFSTLESLRKQAKSWPEEKAAHGLPLGGGLMGCFGYGFYRWCDAGWQSQPAQENPEWPELVLCEFEDWLFLNLQRGEWIILSPDENRKKHYLALWDELCRTEPELSPALQAQISGDAGILAEYLRTFEPSLKPDAFEQAVDRLKSDIFNGEIYQANLSIRLQKTLQVDPYVLFQRLCRKNPSPFSGFFKWPGGIVVSNSPERLISLNETGRADTRPIAGTRGRGKTPEEDAQIGQTLLSNEKELAEHLMLVDLARNDLGRVCEPGSVQVDDLLTLERYSHVTHLVSNVTGQLRQDCTGWDLIKSLFPGGTITGCPKIRCVEILSEVEPVPRGFYTGSMGFLDAASPALDLNILIRSLFLRPTADPLVYNTAVQIGGGIVHDSVGAYEARECLRKATASLNELYAIESAQHSQLLNV
jgi:anthranilate/para-aminobenzoate synthase component I